VLPLRHGLQRKARQGGDVHRQQGFLLLLLLLLLLLGPAPGGSDWCDHRGPD